MSIALRYSEPRDIELAGLAAAALALGSAPLIVAAAERLVAPFGPSPAATLSTMRDVEVADAVGAFRYRFFDEADLTALLCAARDVADAHGGLERAFLAGDDPTDIDYAAAASRFVLTLARAAPSPWRPNLFPDPGRGSAAKRVFLYLRWMVRKDSVDPGPWASCERSRLVVPLDTHMAAACRRLGLLERRSTDLRAAREATQAFRAIRPDDPVRYDFCMTRPGIRPDLDPDECFA